MISAMKPFEGKVLTARGPVEPAALGKVLMHEHLHCDIYDWAAGALITEERPATEERRQFMLREAVPLLRECHRWGCHGYCDVTMPPWRAWPALCREVAEAADTHMVLSTGFYREMEMGTYWVKKPEDRIWPRLITDPPEALADFCIREISEGIHGTGVRAGAIKLGSSGPALTDLERKAFKIGAAAQKATGVHITTHCTHLGAESSQLALLEREGVDLGRVVIGHTAWHLGDPSYRLVCLNWMKKGAIFLPTNLGVKEEDQGEPWRPLVEAFHDVFDAGFGDRLCLGLDHGFGSEIGAFKQVSYLPPSPWTHLFTHTLPAFRRMGLTDEEEDWILRRNPQRILPVQ